LKIKIFSLNLFKKMERKEIKKRIEARGFKKSWLAKEIGISAVMFSYFINGHKEISEKKKKALSDILNIEVH